MNVIKTPTMTWKNAPDIIGVKELMAIAGIGRNKALEIFNKKDFPRIQNMLKADKYMAELYLKGFRVTANSKDSTLALILLELRKINERSDLNEKNNSIN